MVDTEANPRSLPAVPANQALLSGDRFGRRLDWGLLLAALFAAFAIGPLLYPGFFYSHRGLFAPYEVVGLSQAPAASWLPTLAGDPSLSQGPLPYWAARLLLFAGIAPTGAIKVIFAVSMIAATTGAYVLTRRLARPTNDEPGPVSWPGLVAAATVGGLPFLAGLVYARGNLAEAWTLGLLPWALWSSLASTRLVDGEREPALVPIIVGAALWAAAGLGNVGLTIAGLVLLAVLRPRREGWAGPSGGLVLAGALWAVIAARQPLSFALGPVAPLDLQQVFSPVVSDALRPRDGLTVSLGPVAALALLLTLSPLGARRPVGLAVFALIAITASLAVTSPVWERMPALVSQPYQLLGAAGLALALAAGLLLQAFHQARPMAAAAISVLALVAGSPAFTFQPVAVQEPTAFNPYLVDGNIVLLESGLQAGDARPGGSVVVLLVWQGRAPVGRNLTVFTHLQDQAHVVVAQHDGPPVDGRRPTSGWRQGEALVDFHQIQIPADLPPGRYQVVAGMYVPATGDRVGMLANGRTSDAILLGEVEIR
ncbi:MAG: hypothetical protein U0556_08480 [Dehalococcoidia bacterium]